MSNSSWNASTSGDWSNATDWMGGVPNTAAANATITAAGTYTVTIKGTLAAGKTSAADTITIVSTDAFGDKDTHTIGITVTPTGQVNQPSLFAQFVAAGFGQGSAAGALPAFVPPLIQHLELAAHH